MKYSCTGVILTGGLNKRFSGTEKAFLRMGQTRIIDRIFSIFETLFEEIVFVTNNPAHYLEWNANIVTDVYAVRSALTGIHTGLFYCTYSHAFFSACDTPFLDKDVVEYVISSVHPKIDVVLPETSAGLEPLCAVYSKNLCGTMEKQLEAGNLRIQDAIRKHRVRKLKETELRNRDPDLLSFFNINTPEDLAAAIEIDAQRAF
jgi:molybdopterin-guanine dinucleotide biosynthesis protein A